MKKILILLAMIVLGFNIQAQDKVIQSPFAGYSWGVAATDTLVASDTISYVVQTRSKNVMDVSLTLQMTKVSGTVTNVFKFYGANVLTEAAYDSIGVVTYTDAASGYSNINITSFNYKYIIFRGISGATAQKAWYKMTYVIRND